MRIVVLRIFYLLVTNLHHRLLAEGAIRIPLDRVIRHCHQLEDSAGNADIKYEMAKLICAIFRHLKSHSALVHLFLEHTSSDSGVEDVQFSYFLFLLDYLTNTHNPTECVAREAFCIGMYLASNDQTLCTFALKSQAIETVIERLVMLFSMMPVVLSTEKMLTAPSEQQILPIGLDDSDISRRRKSIREEQGSRGPASTRDALAVHEFFEFWTFVNQLLQTCAQASHRTPSKHASYPGSELRQGIIDQITSTFFGGFIFSRIAQRERTDGERSTTLDYVVEMLNDVRDQKFLRHIVRNLVSDDCGLSTILLDYSEHANDQVCFVFSLVF